MITLTYAIAAGNLVAGNITLGFALLALGVVLGIVDDAMSQKEEAEAEDWAAFMTRGGK